MKLIRKTRIEINKNGYKIRYGIFLCPSDNEEIECQISNGKKAKFCKKHKKNNYKHGGCDTRLYSIWDNLKNRCINPNRKDYKDYGGRGITICDDWLEFIPFRDWSLNNGYADNLEIDRWPNNDGNYEPKNCRWVTHKENCNNRRKGAGRKTTFIIRKEIKELYNSKYYTQEQLAKKYNVSQMTVSKIIRNKI